MQLNLSSDIEFELRFLSGHGQHLLGAGAGVRGFAELIFGQSTCKLYSRPRAFLFEEMSAWYGLVNGDDGDDGDEIQL